MNLRFASKTASRRAASLAGDPADAAIPAYA